MLQSYRNPFPHPADAAARRALAQAPPASLEHVLEQAKASEAWRAQDARKPAAAHAAGCPTPPVQNSADSSSHADS